MKPFSDISWLATIYNNLLSWLSSNIFSVSAIMQIAVIIFVFIISSLIAKQADRSLSIKLKTITKNFLIKLNLSYRDIFFLLFLVTFLWISYGVIKYAKQPNTILSTVTSLVSAWAIIRLTSSTIKSLFWSRAVAVTLWSIAALNIVGYLGSFVDAMDNAAINLGQFKFSLLLVFKGVVTFVIIFWFIRLISGLLDRNFSKAEITPSQHVLFFKISNILLYTFGALIGLSVIGIDLTALTVFSGALGLSLGFGLQKVFSNLISGIILLMDKSIKPGDVIAIGDTYGWVNSLGARCVSVLTRDGKEHLIPNENLITQEVENWSYSDERIRIHIEIGVSYKSDIHLVKKLLLQAVEMHPRVLKHPEPVCLITGFGDSSINHDIRAWIEDPEDGMTNIKSDIYYQIWDLFKENNIEIPFPQRDVHLRSSNFE